MVFISGDIVADDADAAGVSRNGQSAGLQIARAAIPDDDLSGLHARLLQPFADGHHQRRVRRDSFAAQPVHLQADHLAHRHNALPRRHRLVVPSVGGDGAVEQCPHTLFVEHAAGVMQRRVARHYDLRLARCCRGQSQLALRAHQHRARGCILQKFTAVFHRVPLIFC